MSISDLPLTYTRADLLAALKAARVKAAKRDEIALAAHRKAEVRHLTEFRKACRAAMKWDYKTLKEKGGYVAGRSRSAPSCPTSQASRIDSLIAMVERINQPRFTLSRHGKWGRIYEVLTADVPEIKGVC